MEDLGHSFAGIKEFKNGPGGGRGRGLGRGRSSEEPWGPSGLGVRAGLRMGLLQVMGTGCLPERRLEDNLPEIHPPAETVLRC